MDRDEARWQLLEQLLLSLRHEGLAEALTILARGLGAAGASVLEWTDRRREPAALAFWGEPGAVEAENIAAALDWEHEKWLSIFQERMTDAVVAFTRSVPPSRAIIVWGVTEATVSKALLRIFLCSTELVYPSQLSPSQGGSLRAPSKLRFPPGIVAGRSETLAAVYREMEMLLGTDLPILILGESGVGKEHLVYTLHHSGARRAGPLEVLNCAAIPQDLLEAELFGIGKGVATGVQGRMGSFERADGGTLFLDEVGEMPPPLQAKLLRVLQEGEVHPVGRRPRRVDIAVVAATNADLKQRIAAGLFRQDLFYRLAGTVLKVPPLRERQEDIPLLVESFLADFSATSGQPTPRLTLGAWIALRRYPWPGNVRELRHEVQRLTAFAAAGEPTGIAMLSPRIRQAVAELNPEGSTSEDSPGLEIQVRDLERRLIRTALNRARGNRTRAAKLLGISRQGLWLKLRRLEIEVPRQDQG